MWSSRSRYDGFSFCFDAFSSREAVSNSRIKSGGVPSFENAPDVASRHEMARSGKAGEGICELVAIKRLDQETVHARSKPGIAVFHQRVRREREDGRRLARLPRLAGADALGGFDPVETGHL